MAEGPTISRVELRKSLYQYLQKKLRLIRYTPPGHPENFDNQWHYMSSVLVAKTIKDMIIQSGKIEEEFTQEMVNDIFFVDNRVWNKVNSLVISMNMYIFSSPLYQKINTMEQFQKAAAGDKEM